MLFASFSPFSWKQQQIGKGNKYLSLAEEIPHFSQAPGQPVTSKYSK